MSTKTIETTETTGATGETMDRKKAKQTARQWAVPVVGIVAGAVMGGAVASQGKPGLGLFMFLLMVVVSAAVVALRRFEPVALLAEESKDERRHLIQLRAGYFALNVVAVTVIVGFVVDVLNGGDGQPWSLIGFIGGLSFVVAIVVLSRRS